MTSGYYRYPTIGHSTIVFVSEDDLWTLPSVGGIARRLTSNLGEVSYPRLSPNGDWIAFVGREEGQAEIYIMPGSGGEAKRLTYLAGSLCIALGWTNDGKIVFANNAEHWYLRFTHLYTLDPEGGVPQKLMYGQARDIAFGPLGGVLLGRHTDDPARWKRYRGGTAGRFWIDRTGSGAFVPFLENLGNLASPIWIAVENEPSRIYFISDHEGIGNLYSCLPSGEDLNRHSSHSNYYVRNASSDGRLVVYQAGADLYTYDPLSDRSFIVPIDYHSPRVQRNRKFVDSARYLQDWNIHPNGQALVITSRGKLFSFANWEGAVIQPEDPQLPTTEMDGKTAVRYRLPAWLPDGKRMIAVTDIGGEESFVIFNLADGSEPELLPRMDVGRPIDLEVNPCGDKIAFSNNRHELWYLDLQTKNLRLVDRSDCNRIGGFNWSPDGAWIAYSFSVSLDVSILKIWNATDGQIIELTSPVLRDVAPAFDPQGKYLYFLSYRTFNPVYDSVHFELSFPRGMKPYLITLQKDLGSPFIPRPRLVSEADEPKNEGVGTDSASEGDKKGSSEKDEPDASSEKKDEEKGKKESKPTQIDLEGIQERIVAFPVSESIYGRVLGVADGKILYTRFPIEGALGQTFLKTEPESGGTLYVYNVEEQKEESLFYGITDFKLSGDAKTMLYRSGSSLRVLKAGEKPNNEAVGYTRKGGWIDLQRVKVQVDPGSEWRQMYREAWRLQRDQFWSEDMSEVDWLSIHDRYLPLVDRVGSRAEFSDLMWEMQGELGTSHAYEFGGDYRPAPKYSQGYLGADFIFDTDQKAWRIVKILRGDVWDSQADSPLRQPGANIQIGDYLLAINQRRLSEEFSPAQALVNHAAEEVTLTVKSAESRADQLDDEKPGKPASRIVIVKTLHDDTNARYREWVETNRLLVHQASAGRLGYLHIPDMGPMGYAEFHRSFMAESSCDGLIVDLRYNRGGDVSSLLLEKLARKRIGYDVSRWNKKPFPYPPYSIAGPMVALTNEYAGSDGDIFSHGFKMLKMGLLIGKRTWGGVVGIWPRHTLVDGTLTTQPEFSFWFADVGWNIENYGTDPDIEVDIAPQDYACDVDTQLQRAIQETLKLLETNPPQVPDFSKRPSKAAPKLI